MSNRQTNLALALSPEGIGLYRSTHTGGWEIIDQTPIRIGTISTDMRRLRTRATTYGTSGGNVCVWLPPDQILTRIVTIDGETEKEQQNQIFDAFAGADGQSPDSLLYTIGMPAEAGTPVAAVPIATLRETEHFLGEHDFLPTMYSTAEPMDTFNGAPEFHLPLSKPPVAKRAGLAAALALVAGLAVTGFAAVDPLGFWERPPETQNFVLVPAPPAPDLDANLAPMMAETQVSRLLRPGDLNDVIAPLADAPERAATPDPARALVYTPTPQSDLNEAPAVTLVTWGDTARSSDAPRALSLSDTLSPTPFTGTVTFALPILNTPADSGQSETGSIAPVTLARYAPSDPILLDDPNGGLAPFAIPANPEPPEASDSAVDPTRVYDDADAPTIVIAPQTAPAIDQTPTAALPDPAIAPSADVGSATDPAAQPETAQTETAFVEENPGDTQSLGTSATTARTDADEAPEVPQVAVINEAPPIVPPRRPVVNPEAEAEAEALAALIEQTVEEDLAPTDRAILSQTRPLQRPEQFAAATPPEEDPEAPVVAEGTPAPEADPDLAPTERALASANPPRARPADLAARAAAIAARRPEPEPAPATPQPSAPSSGPQLPTSANVAQAATIQSVLPRRALALIGVFGSNSNRHALVRTPNGRYIKVQRGDNVDGHQVAAISRDAIRIRKNGRDRILVIPK